MKKAAVIFHENDFNYDEFATTMESKGSTILAPLLPEEEAAQVLATATKDGVAWDDFYKREKDPYKPRRYLSTEFPYLLNGQSFLFKLLPDWLRKFKSIQCFTRCRRTFLFDVGCGYGSALLPLLEENPCLHALACDLSPTAVNILATNPLLDKNRVQTHPWDITKGMPPSLEVSCEMHGKVDLVLLIFTLSAIDPKLHVPVLRQIQEALSPDGVICFRDRARYDLTMIRSKQRVAASTFAREDGTLAHYFTVEELSELAEKAGLELIEEPKYCTVSMKNRQKGTSMNRCYIHGALRRKREGPAKEEAVGLLRLGYWGLGATVIASAIYLVRKRR